MTALVNLALRCFSLFSVTLLLASAFTPKIDKHIDPYNIFLFSPQILTKATEKNKVIVTKPIHVFKLKKKKISISLVKLIYL